MLSKEDNELLCRVGRGMPMGELLRQYWLPCLQEHLGTTDAMVIWMRRRLIDAAQALRDEGVVPANVDDPTLYRIRPASILLPEGESWITATEKARQSDAGAPIAWVPFV